MKITRHAGSYPIGVMVVVALSVMPAATLWADTREEVAPSPPSIATLQSTYGKLPLSFEANQGQWDPSVQFVTRGRGHQLFLTPSEAVLTVRTGSTKTDGRSDHTPQPKLFSSLPPSSHSVVRMQFAGADSQAEMVGLDTLPGIVNYFIGDDPSKWRTNIPTYQKVGYKDLYPGIDLVYYGNQGHLEYDLVVAPGADPTQITLAFDGAEQIAVDDQGDLVLTLPQQSAETAEQAAPTLRLHKPVVYQRDQKGEKHLLAGSYVLLASQQSSDRPMSAVLYSSVTPHVAFQVASYDASKPLIIDPVLSWATYLGGNETAYGGGIAVDAAGNAYVSYLGGGAPGYAVVTKLNAAGTAIVYSTSLGGSNGASGSPIAVDQAGQVYVTGWTMSPDFPGTAGSSIQGTFGGGFSDAFVAKLNDTGTAILYSTYLGGSGGDQGNEIAVDAIGQAYVTGITDGGGFPGTAGSPIQNTSSGNGDAFVVKINEAGTALLYSTYLGGSGGDSGLGITVDKAGNAYVTGFTGSSSFPGTAGSHIQSGYGGGENDAFITKLNAAGTAILYSTYLGGSGGDVGEAIAVDQVGQVYVTGGTGSSLFPGTVSSLIQRTFGGDGDAFVTKLNTAGTAILYSTYLGGSGADVGRGIALDATSNVYVTGITQSLNFPDTARSPIQRTNGGGNDAFLAKLNATGTAILFSTYLGGSSNDFGEGIAVDAAGQAYVTGETTSSNFPGTTGSLIQSTLRAQSNIFVAKITSTSLVNDLVTLAPLASTYRTSADPTGCPSGFVGTFSFDARLTTKTSSPPLSDLAVQVKTLTNGNLLQNADGGNGGVGSMLTVPKTSGYADGTLSPGESVEVHFSICLKAKKPFSFFVDVLGMRQE
jgi:hypothetical protein